MTICEKHTMGDRRGETAATAIPVVLYDGGCPLCVREIAHYRRQPGADRLMWVDITREPDLEGRFGIARDRAMARFHVRDARGRWLTGVGGFAEVWSHLPGYRLLARAMRRRSLLRLLDRFYDHFARWRLARRCRDDRCLSGRSSG